VRVFTGSVGELGWDYTPDLRSGLVQFAAPPGGGTDRLVITYTGGFWLDPLDGSEMPSGATALPDDLLEAWVSEVQAQAEARSLFDAAGIRTAAAADKAKKPNGLSEDTIATLAPYRRFAGE
jgi:hypothetical protein